MRVPARIECPQFSALGVWGLRGLMVYMYLCRIQFLDVVGFRVGVSCEGRIPYTPLVGLGAKPLIRTLQSPPKPLSTPKAGTPKSAIGPS